MGVDVSKLLCSSAATYASKNLANSRIQAASNRARHKKATSSLVRTKQLIPLYAVNFASSCDRVYSLRHCWRMVSVNPRAQGNTDAHKYLPIVCIVKEIMLKHALFSRESLIAG